MEERIITDGCIDIPSKEDYDGDKFLDMCSGRGDYARPYDEIVLRDQGSVPSCTRHGLVHLNNGQNIIEYRKSGFKYEQKDPAGVWERSNKSRLLVSALDQLKKGGDIEGYTYISKTIDNFKKSIDNGYYVYTGIQGVTRSETYKKPVLNVGENGIGHAFAIIDYDDSKRLFKIINSFGKERGDHGYLYIKYEDIGKLMSCYSVIDKDNSGLFKIFKDKQKAINAITKLKEVWNSIDDPVVRGAVHTQADYIRKLYKIKPEDEK